MKKSVRTILAGILCLTVLILMFVMCLNQSYMYTGFRITSSEFIVNELFSYGPAERAGFQKGDKIVAIDDIDTIAFAEEHYGGKNSDWCFSYSTLFKKGELYRFTLSTGETRYFRLPETLSLGEKLHFLSIDDKVGYSVGALFILLGIALSLLSREEFDISAFTELLYSMGLCLANAYWDSHNSAFYSICNLILFQLSTAGIASSMLQIVAFFFRLAGREIRGTRVNNLCLVPFILTIVRIVTVMFSPMSFFDGILYYLPYLNLAVLVYAVVVFFYLMHHIPAQSSLVLRFFLVGICFSLAPAIVKVLSRIFLARLIAADTGESLVTFLPLLFIPICLFCSFVQTRRTGLDAVVSRIMVISCSLLIIYILTCLPFQGTRYKILLFLLVPFLSLFLEKPVSYFLYPQIDSITESFGDLEKLLFACDSENDMYALVTDWLYNVLNPSFVVFYETPDDDKGIPGKTLYKRGDQEIMSSSCLISLIANRCSAREERDQIVIHENWGISAPIFKAHHVFGYVFIGCRSRFEMFSNNEMRVLIPAARILMEALLVLDLKQQVEYINNMQNRIVYSFADMIESRDGTTGQHVKRTSLVVDLLTRYLKKNGIYANELKPGEYALISLAAPLHDIGKIKVPDRILSKPGKLTDEEFEIIKTHPVVGEKIINKTMFKIEDDDYLKTAREMALYHHEKWDGSGYPEGLKGKQIPISARVMAVADVFDALCSSRSYKKAFTVNQAFDIIDKSSGTHFEPVLVEVMHTLRGELEKIYRFQD